MTDFTQGPMTFNRTDWIDVATALHAQGEATTDILHGAILFSLSREILYSLEQT